MSMPPAEDSREAPAGRLRVTVGPMSAADWPAVRAIYQEGIATRNATFQTQAPGWEEWDAAHLASCRLVARDASDRVVGWAALSPVSSRPVYRGVCEVSVYVAAVARGRGAGHALLRALITESERDGRWTLQAGVFPENHASVALHLGCGFRVLGTRHRPGMLDGVWRDVLLLERRSAAVGA